MENSKKFNCFIIIIYLLITIAALCFHEIWRDEAQAWCLVRDLGFIDLLNAVKIEGHPILWYLVLFPFAKIHLNVETMQIVSLLFVFISVIFLLFKSSFNNFQKILIVFSSGMLYYLPVVARNYSLIPLFLFLNAYFYSKREEKPYQYLFSLLILSHTHLYMLGFCIINFLLYVFEIRKKLNIKNIVPIIILLLNFLFIRYLFLNSIRDNYALLEGIKSSLSLKDTLFVIAQVYLYNIISYLPILRNSFRILSVALFYPSLCLILYSFFKTDKKIFIICFLSLAYIIGVFTLVYFNGILYQKIFLIILILIWGLWCSKPVETGKIGFYILLLLSLITSLIVINEEIKYNFSGGKEIAKYIKTNLDYENTFIAVGNPYLYSPISAYLPDKKFYNVISKSYITYYSFNNLQNNIPSEYPENSKYSIVQEDIKIPVDSDLNRIFESKQKNLSSKTQREVFKIYTSNE